MLSMPPATTSSASPSRTVLVPKITACRPEPQTLFSVVQGTLSGMPAKIDAWRAGAWPTPAVSTLPMKTSPIWSGCSLARSRAALIAIAPSWGARSDASAPR